MEQEKEENEKLSTSAIREMWRNGVRLVKMVLKVRPHLVIGTLGIFVLAALITYTSSGIRALLINALTAGTSGLWTNKVVLLFAGMLLMRFIPDIIWQLRDYWSWVIWFHMEEYFNMLVLGKRADLDIAVHENPKYQNLFQRVNDSGVWRLGGFLDRTFYMLQNSTELIIGGVIIFAFKPWLFFVVLIGLIPDLYIESKYSRTTWGIDAAKGDVKRRYWNLQNHFRNVSNLTELKLNQIAGNFIERISKLFRDFRGGEEKIERDRLRGNLFAAVISTISIGVALGWGVNSVIDGVMKIGTLLFLFSSVMDLRQALSALFSNLARQYKDSLYLTDTFKFLDLQPIIKSLNEGHSLEDKTPEIKFENVSFAYEGKKELVLKNVNLTIKPGQKLAIIGVNGAGKTTLIKLLCRFYDPTSGRILIDGHDLRKINLESWHEKLGAIFQDYSHYEFAVKESIAITSPDSRPVLEKVKESAKSAEADTFITEWDKGYNQMLGKQFEGGIEPSIGQWQKLALARTFYRDPRILILDEPTSSIDAEAEAKIFEKLESLPSDRSVILISHRFSTVRHANQIIVLENGTISEQGTHTELLKLNKTYARLFKLQAKGYK